MPNILVRGVPVEVHAVLVERAKVAGQSLQQYVLGLLTEATARPTMREAAARWAAMAKVRAAQGAAGPTREQFLRALDDGREERARQLEDG